MRNGYSSPLKPTPRLAWDCMIRPEWPFGTFLRTLHEARHAAPREHGLRAHAGAVGLVERPRLAARRLCWGHSSSCAGCGRASSCSRACSRQEDVRIARESGVDGIIVSNHGGRQLDGTVAPLRMLPAVVAEAGNMAVMMDSGIRRGTDVLKALALGAHSSSSAGRSSMPRRSRRRGRAPRGQAAARGDRPRHGDARHHQPRRNEARVSGASRGEIAPRCGWSRDVPFSALTPE